MGTAREFELYSFWWPPNVFVEELAGSLLMLKVCYSIRVVIVQIFLFLSFKHISVPPRGKLELYSFWWPLYVFVKVVVGSLMVPKVGYSIPVVVIQMFLFFFFKHILESTIGELELYSFLWPLYVSVERLASCLLVPKVCYNIPIVVI